MRAFPLLILLASCASYTDPEQEKLTYYKCEKNQTVVVKHSDDYEAIMMKIGKEQILLHHFVTERGDAYHTEKYLWVVQGAEAKLMTKKADGTEEVVLGSCQAQKMDLDY